MNALRKLTARTFALGSFLLVLAGPASAGVSFDVSVSKDDGVTEVVAGGSVTYTIVLSNEGPSTASGTFTDDFPPTLTCSWTCNGGGGGSCTAGPVSGDISDPFSLPASSSVTYTAGCTLSASATGTLENAVTVDLLGDTDDANNSDSDVDTILPAPSDCAAAPLAGCQTPEKVSFSSSRARPPLARKTSSSGTS